MTGDELSDSLQTQLLAMTAQKDGAYLERNRCVALIARMALAVGWRAGVARTAIEGWSEDWHGCVYIDLPTGQCSWHFHDSQTHLFDGLPAYTDPWDGHDTPEKYRRVDAACRRIWIPPRWYCITRDGAATLCVDQADALAVAADEDLRNPESGPHQAVLLQVQEVSWYG